MLQNIRTGKRLAHLCLLLLIPAAAFSLNAWSSGKFPATFSNSSYPSPLPDTAKNLLPDSAEVPGPVAAVIPLNKHAAGFVSRYVLKEAEFLQKMKQKSRAYFHTIEKLLEKQGLPPQLKYLAIVESQLRPRATSAAGARGLWQLMPETAQELGLKITSKTDERLHPYRSTVAATRYLRNLYALFGDWLLVLAAYNSGPGPVLKAIKKAGSRNYWALQRYLPAESRGHVKRFIGVHYYFEEAGSITTQTKAEAEAWQERFPAGG